MFPADNKLYRRAEIYPLLLKTLLDKTPLPPQNWCPSILDEELRKEDRQFEPDPLFRQREVLETTITYLAHFALNMPERVNLTESNHRVREICDDLASEIEKITFEPEAVIKKHGTLKAWLYAILSVQTCLIYTEETDRFNTEQDELKRLQRKMAARQKSAPVKAAGSGKSLSPLAQKIFEKAAGKTVSEVSEQGSLF